MSGRREDRSSLGAPVIMEIDQFHIKVILHVAHQFHIEISQMIEEFLHTVLLVFIHHGSGSIFKSHKRDQPLEKAGKDHAGKNLVCLQILFVLFRASGPVQFGKIRELNIFFPVVGIIK